MLKSYKKYILLIILLTFNFSLAKPSAKVGTPDGVRASTEALNELLRAYELGDTSRLRTQFDSSMIGYQKLLDGIAIESNRCKQMRINLFDTKTLVGPDLAVIQTSWEKRCLLVPTFKPVLDSGQSSFLLHRNSNGWKMTGISGSNPLTPVNIPASLSASTTTTCISINPITAPLTKPFTITVSDPYQAKSPHVNVKVVSGIDTETIALLPVAGQPGVFQVTSLQIAKGIGTSGNNIVEVVATGGVCASVKVSYVSNNATTGTQALSTTVIFP